ncbi:MAG: ribokinase [Clostridia bacterium]|nr:ribokinase [Clostridia bacterium]
MKILNFGSLNIDHVYKVKNFVTPGETVKSKEYVKKVGGKGLNQSIALARAGVEVYHAGAVGEDGKFLVDFLKKDNVITDYINISEIPTGHAIIQVDETGENCILLYGGANQSIKEAYAENVLSFFAEGDYVVLQNETNIVHFVMEKAHEKKMKIVFNPSPITEDMKNFPLENVDWFILNEVEAETLTDEKEIERMITSLKSKYPSSAFVLTLGDKGAIYFNKDEIISVEAEKVKAVDTTAAGDTFTGYFLANIAKGAGVKEALQQAAKAAAKAITVLGAAESIPYM